MKAYFTGHINYIKFTGDNLQEIKDLFGEKYFKFSLEDDNLLITNAEYPECRGQVYKNEIVFEWSEEPDRIYDMYEDGFWKYFREKENN